MCIVNRDTYDSYVDDRMIAAANRQGEALFLSSNLSTYSEYITWVSEQSGGISDFQPLEHLVILHRIQCLKC